jgi:hypothetical protein
MGKRIEDLGPLDERPIVPHQEDGDSGLDWKGIVADIEELRRDDRYLWAEETLSGIQETIEHRRAVSEAQRRAVENIRYARSRPAVERGPARVSRRYEGWRRS